jgi:hypothetical protein
MWGKVYRLTWKQHVKCIFLIQTVSTLVTQSQHQMLRMTFLLFTVGAQIVVDTFHALEAKTEYFAVAPITHDPGVLLQLQIVHD